MRHVEHRAQHVADAVTGAHRHAAASPPIDSHEPIWQSAALACLPGQPSPWQAARQHREAMQAEALVNSVDSLEHTPSTQ